jgi:acetyl-CoA carboxylase biotin carboxyl carrier protein
MSLTAKDVAEIMRLLEDSSFDNLSLEIDGMKLHLERTSAKSARPVPDRPGEPTQTAPPSATAPPRLAKKHKPPSEPGLCEVPSPLLGFFYRAPKPGEPPFVEVGSHVEEDTAIGIIEVMKLMNTVHGGREGRSDRDLD